MLFTVGCSLSVGFVDLILVVVLDVIVASVASYSLFLRRAFFRGKWRVSLAWNVV